MGRAGKFFLVEVGKPSVKIKKIFEIISFWKERKHCKTDTTQFLRQITDHEVKTELPYTPLAATLLSAVRGQAN